LYGKKNLKRSSVVGKCVLCGKPAESYSDQCSSCFGKLKSDFERGWMAGRQNQRSQNRDFEKDLHSLDDNMTYKTCPLCSKLYFGKIHHCDASREFQGGFQAGRNAGRFE
jgi:hypothetical protein